MTQRKSSEERAQARAIGRRLRALRGESSQADFAARFGVSRSALANYELGRSFAPKELLERVSAAYGADISWQANIEDFEEDLRSLTAEIEGFDEDELALIRLIRVSKPEVVRRVVQELVSGFEEDNEGLWLADRKTVMADLVRLIVISRGDREFNRGLSGANIMATAHALARAVARKR